MNKKEYMNKFINHINIYSRKKTWKTALFIFAILIGVSSLLYTNMLVKKLADEERKKIELWAEATKQLANITNIDTDISFFISIIQNNETVPVILTDKDGNILSHRNLDKRRVNNPDYLNKQMEIMSLQHEPIMINLDEEDHNYIYYKDSFLLYQLYYYPYIQLAVIIMFIMFAYYAFNVSRKAEQNQVWVGLSKETAHQLGTPTSSLLAWVELLKMKNVEEETVNEIEKDVARLQKITERFSKIGSKTILKHTNIVDVLENVRSYLVARMPKRVKFNLIVPEGEVMVPLNASLFEWVLENVCKNAYDAIADDGEINVKLKKGKRKVYIDISDTGKGVPKNKQKTIFKPGFTTKLSGWGLGLSLSKRIVENYHNGRIFVYTSESGKGTTIRIILNTYM
jgi:hypothetical protein